MKADMEASMKAMLSQPMAGKTEEEIAATRELAITALEGMGYEVVNTLFTDEWYAPENMKARGVENIPLCFLAKSLESMSKCQAVYFCKGWEQARGCRVEHVVAKAYGLQIFYAEIMDANMTDNKYEGKNFMDLVAEMRAAQKDYFRCRSSDLLQICKELEKSVDAKIAEIAEIANSRKGSGNSQGILL